MERTQDHTAAASEAAPASHGATRNPRRVEAAFHHDAEGKPKAFILSRGEERLTLSPGKSWIKLDEYKWVTRGLIEAPQSFHVQASGAVDINGETIRLDDPEALDRLAREINKQHTVVTPRKPPTTEAAAKGHGAAGVSRSGRPHFHVKLDHFGHLAVECARGGERVETGLRGLPGFIQNGLMLAPKQMHVDPLHRGMELDGVWFECSEPGARLLEEALNARYAPAPQDSQEAAIEIRENPAAATGFEIHFVTTLSGARFEVKGHLAQDKLDLLQDQAKCDLLKPGILLRLSPPNLLVRRRRPDGGEEHLPELPDISYRRVTAAQLQQVLNHPLIRRNALAAGSSAPPPPSGPPPEIVELRVVRNPQNKLVLWLEPVWTRDRATEGKAFTHHNVAELQQAGVFLPHLDVNLSLDSHTLSILNKETHREESATIDTHSSDADLATVSCLLTAALKPRTPLPVEVPLPVVTAPPTAAMEPPGAEPAPVVVAPEPLLATATVSPPPPLAGDRGNSDIAGTADAVTTEPEPPPTDVAPLVEVPVAGPDPVTPVPAPAAAPVQDAPPATVVAPAADATALGPFEEPDPLRVNREVFQRLAGRLGVTVQDILLTLPRAFENRRFEVLSFSPPEIDTILDLRAESFYGFYLSHVSEQKVLLVYACAGRHVEWGPTKCLLQASVSAEPHEFKGPALQGMAQDASGNFVFVVVPAFREWARPHEHVYGPVCARFLTARELLADPAQYSLIWPESDAPESHPPAVTAVP